MFTPSIETRLRVETKDLMSAFVLTEQECKDAVLAAAQRMRVQDVLADAFKQHLTEAVQTSVRSFFAYGAGHTIVERAVSDAFAAMLKSVVEP